METIRKETKMSYPGDKDPLISVSYHMPEDIFLIFNSACVMEVDRQIIPALIAMLQSINSGIK